MLLQAAASISNWKIQFSSSIASQPAKIFQQQTPVKTMISTFQSNDQKFGRFFTKTARVPQNSLNEQDTIEKVKHFLNGTNGFHKDPQKAVELLKKLVDNGSTRAMIMYAGMIENGVGIQKADVELAGRYYKQASEKDKSPESSLMYLQFLERHHKKEELESYIKNIEGEGDGDRLFILGLFSLHKNELDKCDQYLKQSISKGNVDAMILQASMIVSTNPNESLALLKSAIQKGSYIAMYGYASFIAKGEFKSLKIDREKEAFTYMKKAADEGNMRDAIVTLAEWLLSGFCCVRNFEDSLKYYKKAADSFDDPFSQYFYGSLLLGNEKLNKNVGFNYVEKSAEKNYPDALFKLGFCFLNGNGVEKNIYKANKYFKLAADSENADADMILNYAVRLLVGEKIKKDEKNAEVYLKKGANLGNKMCNQLLKIFK